MDGSVSSGRSNSSRRNAPPTPDTSPTAIGEHEGQILGRPHRRALARCQLADGHVGDHAVVEGGGEARLLGLLAVEQVGVGAGLDLPDEGFPPDVVHAQVAHALVHLGGDRPGALGPDGVLLAGEDRRDVLDLEVAAAVVETRHLVLGHKPARLSLGQALLLRLDLRPLVQDAAVGVRVEGEELLLFHLEGEQLLLQRLDHRVGSDRRRELDALGFPVELLLDDRRALLGLLQVVLGVDDVVLGFGEAAAVGVDLRSGGGQRRLVPEGLERGFRLLEARGQLVALLLEELGDPGVGAHVQVRLAVPVEESIDDIGALDGVGAPVADVDEIGVGHDLDGEPVEDGLDLAIEPGLGRARGRSPVQPELLDHGLDERAVLEQLGVDGHVLNRRRRHGVVEVPLLVGGDEQIAALARDDQLARDLVAGRHAHHGHGDPEGHDEEEPEDEPLALGDDPDRVLQQPPHV